MAIGLFQFWKRTKTKSRARASDLPLFSSLSPTELKLIQNKIRRVEYKKGDFVYRIGEPAEAFYIILSGRFRVIGAKNETLTVLSQGDYFGESSILLGRDHSATVEVKNDGLLLKIDKSDFQNLLTEIPALSLHLSRTLGHRLAASTSGSEAPENRVLSIFSHDCEADQKAFAWNLAAMLGINCKKKTIFVSLEKESARFFQSISKKRLFVAEYSPKKSDLKDHIVHIRSGSFDLLRMVDGVEGEAATKQMAALLTFLIDRYDFVLLVLPRELDDFSVQTLKQSDLVYFLTSEEFRSSSKTQSYLREFQSSFGFTQDQIRFILSAGKGKKKPKHRPFRLNDAQAINVFGVLPREPLLPESYEEGDAPYVVKHPDSAYTKVIGFLSRELTGNLIGLALGSGAAYGFAHLGTLKVLEEEKIPIDIIAGSSIGALLGAMWASGLSSERLESIAKEFNPKSTFFKLVGFRDFSVPHRGFFKGLQVKRFLRHFLNRISFRDLKIPIKIVAADLFTGEEVIFDDGDVVDAIRASISIPGIFRPVRMKNQVLIDGGVVDPLPVRVLSRYGVKKIIAANVLPSAEDHAQRMEFYEAQMKEQSREAERSPVIRRFFHFLGERIRLRFRDNVFNVLMNTIQFLEYGIAESSAEGADILIHAVAPNSHWAEFYSVEKFIRCGEEKTRERIGEIKKLVAENIHVAKV